MSSPRPSTGCAAKPARDVALPSRGACASRRITAAEPGGAATGWRGVQPTARPRCTADDPSARVATVHAPRSRADPERGAAWMNSGNSAGGWTVRLAVAGTSVVQKRQNTADARCYGLAWVQRARQMSRSPRAWSKRVMRVVYETWWTDKLI
jgi:hypothetical protein